MLIACLQPSEVSRIEKRFSSILPTGASGKAIVLADADCLACLSDLGAVCGYDPLDRAYLLPNEPDRQGFSGH